MRAGLERVMDISRIRKGLTVKTAAYAYSEFNEFRP
jgi:hypothetical protein